MVPIQLGLDPELPAIFVWLDNIADSFFIIDVLAHTFSLFKPALRQREQPGGASRGAMPLDQRSY